MFMPDGLLKLCLNAVENKILNFLFLIIILSLSILVLIVNEKMGHIYLGIVFLAKMSITLISEIDGILLNQIFY